MVKSERRKAYFVIYAIKSNLLPDSQFELTPLYDIISLYPVIWKNSINIRDAKLAMSLRGKNGEKYSIETIFPKHFLQTADYVGFSRNEMVKIIEKFSIKTPDVINQVLSQLPDSFSKEIADSILHGLEKRAKRLSLA